MNPKLQERIKQLLAALNKDVFEKEEVTRLAFLTAIAGESIFLLGRPGVAKSLIARRLKFAFKDANSFEYLMNRFSTPDEIFGPISIKKLKDEDKYERLTDNYLPQAHVAFLDEIWKAGPSIQNALLTIINEKVYRNGEKEVPAKLQALIAASNELPEKEQGLEALWDRFLVRLMVTGVSDEKSFENLISRKLTSNEDNIAKNLKITIQEYKDWGKKIDDVSIPIEVFKVINAIRKQIQEYSYNYHEDVYENEIYISDRRWRKIVRLLRTSAFLNDRQEVDLMDCFLIANCIWNEQEQINDMKDLVADVLKKHGYNLKINTKSIKNEINEFYQDEVSEICQTVTYTYSPLEVENGFYEIEGLNHFQNCSRIKISDFNNISNRTNIYFYDKNGNHIKQLYISLKNKEEYILEISNNRNTVEAKIKTESKKNIAHKAPSKMTKKIWDRFVYDIIQRIEEQVNEVKKYRQNQLAHLRTNLFVDSKLAKLIEKNLFTHICDK